jgi:hypothetical protein
MKNGFDETGASPRVNQWKYCSRGAVKRPLQIWFVYQKSENN